MCHQVSPAISSLPYPLYFNTNFDINIPSSKENCKNFYLSCVLHTPPIPMEVLPFSISALISVYKHEYKATCWLFKIEVKLTPQSTVHLGVVVSYRCHYLTNTKLIRKVNTVCEYIRRRKADGAYILFCAFKVFRIIELPADCEMQSVIRFLNARNVKPADIHRQICEVYGENAVSDRMVRKWVRNSTTVVITCTTNRGAAGRLWSQAATFYE